MSKDCYHVISKRNDLIEASYDLSAAGMNLWNAILARIDPTAETLPEFTFTRSSLAAFMKQSGFDPSTIYRYSGKVVRELLSLSVSIETSFIDGGEKKLRVRDINVFELFDTVYNVSKEQVDHVTFRFTDSIAPTIQHLTKNYTRLQLRILSELESKYSKRFYELFLMGHAITRKYGNKTGSLITTKRYEITKLRSILMIPDKSYKVFPNFRARVLDVVKQEFKEKADIVFDYGPVREGGGRAYTHIDFIIQENRRFNTEGHVDVERQGDLLSSNYDPQTLRLMQMAMAGVSDDEIILYFATYDTVVLKEAASATIRVIMSGDCRSPKGLFDHIAKKAAYEWESVKLKEFEPEQKRSTLEKLLDRSWCVDLWDDDV